VGFEPMMQGSLDHYAATHEPLRKMGDCLKLVLEKKIYRVYVINVSHSMQSIILSMNYLHLSCQDVKSYTFSSDELATRCFVNATNAPTLSQSFKAMVNLFQFQGG
jgi:hypothetical protein